MFSFTAYANLATSPKCLKFELTNITRRHFCSLPVFCIKHSFVYFLLSDFFPLSVCFDILWQLATTHARDNTRDRDANSSRLFDAIFCRGNKSSSRSLARFSRRKHKNLPLALRAREKELSSTCRQVYIGTNKSLPFISNLWRNSVDINVQLSDYYTSIKKTTACLSTS